MRGHLRESDPDTRVHTKLHPQAWAEMKAEAIRPDRSLSWIAQWAWRIAKSRIESLQHRGQGK